MEIKNEKDINSNVEYIYIVSSLWLKKYKNYICYN